MKIFLRNFAHVLSRFKTAALLNILGLSIAFAACMIILMQLNYDRTFDTCHPNHEKIFRIEPIVSQNTAQAIISRPMAELFFTSSPHILAGAISNPWGGDLFFSTDENGTQHFYKEQAISVSPEFTNVFTFDFVEGNKDALKEPDKVMIPLSLSQKLFGKQPALGKQLAGTNKNITVGAVFRDFPSNSSVTNYMYLAIPEDENKQKWGNWNYHAYIRVDNPAHVSQLFENFKQHSGSQIVDFSWGDADVSLRFTALSDLHYVTHVTYDQTPKASKQTLLVLFAIAFVIIIIAGINFTNFSTALTPSRIKSINTQKVLGGDEQVIRNSLILEAILISLFSYVIALGLVVLFSKTPLASLVDSDLSISSHLQITSVTGVIALLTGLLAGLYPAYYMTSFPPALVLKGSFGLSPKGRQMRNILISIQFIASFALIIGAAFMFLQNYYMRHTSLGYEKDQLIVTDLNKQVNKSRDAFINQLRTFSGIKGVTYSIHLISSSEQYEGWGRKYKGQDIHHQCLLVDYSFPEVMGINIIEGRNFRREDSQSKHGAYIFNEKARYQFGLELGALVDSTVIVGFMPDIKFASFRTEVVPMAFYVGDFKEWGIQPNYAYIKVKAGSDMRAAMSHVRTTLAELDANYPFQIRFFDEVLHQVYEQESKLSALITLFSLIAIFIAIVGVFGLVVFDSEYRKKEIGIRKVLGSSTREILILFNKAYFIILCVCFLMATPIAWYSVHKWLQNFAYRTPMYWWVYLIAFIIISGITMFTVTFQNWRAANANPVDSIKSE